jgi:hypothetical protein
VDGHIQPPALEVVAEVTRDRFPKLGLQRFRILLAQDAVVDALLLFGHRVDHRNLGLLEFLKQPRDGRRGHTRLVLIQQRVVGRVLIAQRFRDLDVQIDKLLEPGLEGVVVVVGAGFGPFFMRQRGRRGSSPPRVRWVLWLERS